jgi:hypothetical protein
MEQRVRVITLGVENLERSREFYERLEWRRSMVKAEGIVFFQAGGMPLALFAQDKRESTRAGRRSRVARPLPGGVLGQRHGHHYAGRNNHGIYTMTVNGTLTGTGGSRTRSVLVTLIVQ